jgi:hypothetical protein
MNHTAIREVMKVADVPAAAVVRIAQKDEAQRVSEVLTLLLS